MRGTKRLLCLALVLALPLSTALADGEEAVEPEATQAEAVEAQESKSDESRGEEEKAAQSEGQEDGGSEEAAGESSEPEESEAQEQTEVSDDSPRDEDEGGASDCDESGESGSEEPVPEDSDSGESEESPSEPGDSGSDAAGSGDGDSGEADVPVESEPIEAPEEQTSIEDQQQTEEQSPVEAPHEQTEEQTSVEEPQDQAETPQDQAADEEQGVVVTLTISDPQGLERSGGAYLIAPQQVSSITLTWNCDGECDGYAVSVSGGVYSGKTEDTALTLCVASLSANRYTVTVKALKDGKAVGKARLVFEIQKGDAEGTEVWTPEGEIPEDETPESETPEGGIPGGGSPGGGRRSGGAKGGASGGSGEQTEVEQGFHITAGEALTSSHTAGSRDMRLYGAVALSLEEGTAMTALTLGGEALEIALKDGGSFTAGVEENVLTLTPEGISDAWTMNGYALKALSRSGVETLRLNLNGGTVDFPTRPALTGDVYGALCASGYVSRDFTFTVDQNGVTVAAAGQTWTLNESGELC